MAKEQLECIRRMNGTAAHWTSRLIILAERHAQRTRCACLTPCENNFSDIVQSDRSKHPAVYDYRTHSPGAWHYATADLSCSARRNDQMTRRCRQEMEVDRHLISGVTSHQNRVAVVEEREEDITSHQIQQQQWTKCDRCSYLLISLVYCKREDQVSKQGKCSV